MLFLGTKVDEAQFWMLAFLQQLVALTKNTGILNILKIKLLRRCWPEILPDEEQIADRRSKRLIQAACDNVAGQWALLVALLPLLGLALLFDALHATAEKASSRGSDGV